MKNVMKKGMTFTLAVLMITAALAVPAFAEATVAEATDAETAAASTETISEVAADLTADTKSAEKETESAAFTDEKTDEPTEIETSVKIDEWLYDAIKQATPEQMEMVEKIVMGGVNALDKLGIKGFDRFRVWLDYNMHTVMVIALFVALVAFFVATMMQKKLLHSDSQDFYKAGQAQAEEAQKALKRYADRADKICESCAEAAQEAAKSAKEANGQVTEERAMLIAELDRSAKATACMCETVHFLLQCSDLSQAKRDEAEAIYKRGMEALNGYAESPTEEVKLDEEHDQA